MAHGSANDSDWSGRLPKPPLRAAMCCSCSTLDCWKGLATTGRKELSSRLAGWCGAAAAAAAAAVAIAAAADAT